MVRFNVGLSFYWQEVRGSYVGNDDKYNKDLDPSLRWEDGREYNAVNELRDVLEIKKRPRDSRGLLKLGAERGTRTPMRFLPLPP